MTTTAAAYISVKRIDQLIKEVSVVHAILKQDISQMVPGDPDDRDEFDTLRGFFAENAKKIQDLVEQQATIVDELREISEASPAA